MDSGIAFEKTVNQEPGFKPFSLDNPTFLQVYMAVKLTHVFAL